ncbi:hypothetical protein PQR59_17550 [Paraburkholderia graminis]|jgi:hypothetical protein|nr:hypothetical protein [Paraburkholderia graminis]
MNNVGPLPKQLDEKPAQTREVANSYGSLHFHDPATHARIEQLIQRCVKRRIFAHGMEHNDVIARSGLTIS